MNPIMSFWHTSGLNFSYIIFLVPSGGALGLGGSLINKWDEGLISAYKVIITLPIHPLGDEFDNIPPIGAMGFLV